MSGESKKNWYKKNPDYNKMYYEKNKLKNHLKKVKCDTCGTEVAKNALNLHQKSKRCKYWNTPDRNTLLERLERLENVMKENNLIV
jgi:hypothetical protein